MDTRVKVISRLIAKALKLDISGGSPEDPDSLAAELPKLIREPDHRPR